MGAGYHRRDMDARLHTLHCYPVKSGRAIDLDTAHLGRHGLRHDRSWLFVDAADRFVTQRSHPTLARLDATPGSDGSLRLMHPDAGVLDLPAPAALPTEAAEQRRVRVWRREVAARDCGAQAATFAERLLGMPARLVMAEDATFPDGYPLLVCNLASLAALNEMLPSGIPMARFRPNLVIDGWPPWAEDDIRELRIGTARLRLVKACTRCVVTGIDQQSGQPGVDPMPALRRSRFDPALKGVTFGWNAEVIAGAGSVLRVGDAVEIVRRRQAAAAAGGASSSGTREVT
jgi:hypothetical protein